MSRDTDQTADAAGERRGRSRPALDAGMWLFVGILLAVQAVSLLRFAEHQIVGFVPIGCDQTSYLLQSYRLSDEIRAHGAWTALCEQFGEGGSLQITANGVLLQIQGALVAAAFGSSRLHVLGINLAYYLLFELAFVAVLRWMSGRWSIAILGLGLLLTVRAPFRNIAGWTDFRLDFAASCCLGLVLCAVLRSRAFESRRWSIVVGITSAVLVLIRTVTLVYLAASFLLIGAALVARRIAIRRSESEVRAVDRRIAGLLTAIAVLAAITTPVLWRQRLAIYQYYGIGHVNGPEMTTRIREGVGDSTWINHLTLYPKMVSDYFLGHRFVYAAAVVVGATAVARRRLRAIPGRFADHGRFTDQRFVMFASAALLVGPLAVLTLMPLKVPFVAGICVAPIAGLVMIQVVRMRLATAADAEPAVHRRGFVILVASTLIFGIYSQTRYLTRTQMDDRCRADSMSLVHMYDAIYDRSHGRKWTSPSLFVDRISDVFNAGVAEVLFREQGRSPIAIRQLLLSDVLAVEPSDVSTALAESDFVIRVRRNSETPLYPFDRQMAAMFPELSAWCESRMQPLLSVRQADGEAWLYVRPETDLAVRPRPDVR